MNVCVCVRARVCVRACVCVCVWGGGGGGGMEHSFAPGLSCSLYSKQQCRVVEPPAPICTETFASTSVAAVSQTTCRKQGHQRDHEAQENHARCRIDN